MKEGETKTDRTDRTERTDRERCSKWLDLFHSRSDQPGQEGSVDELQEKTVHTHTHTHTHTKLSPSSNPWQHQSLPESHDPLSDTTLSPGKPHTDSCDSTAQIHNRFVLEVFVYACVYV